MISKDDAECLVDVADALEAVLIEAIATESPLAERVAMTLFLAKRGHTHDEELGVYVAFFERYKACPAVRTRRAELIREGRR